MSNEALAMAQYSVVALYSAMAVLTLAMIAYAVHLAAALARADDAAEVTDETGAQSAIRESVLVGGDGAAVSRPAVPGSTATDSTDAHAHWPLVNPNAPDAAAASRLARKAGGIGLSLSWLATLLLIASAALRGLSVQRAPLGNMFEFALVGSMFLMIAFCIWATRRPLHWLGLFIVGPTLLVLGLARGIWFTEASELMPSLKSFWLIIHVTVATLAVGLFAIGFVLTVLHLVKHRIEGADPGERHRFGELLPRSTVLERLSYSMHIIAFPLWTFTVIVGAVWARQAWGSYWNWDPKEVWSFVIWVVYAAYLHARVTSGWSKERAAYVALAGFACVLINYGIVNIFFVGQHSYSGI